MIEEIVKSFENYEEVPSYNEIIGAFVDIGKGFSEKNVTEIELKLAIRMDTKLPTGVEKDKHWKVIKSRWMERWS